MREGFQCVGVHCVALFGGSPNPIQQWAVTQSGLHSETSPTTSDYRPSIFYKALGKSYIENSFITARQADPNAELYYNDYSLEYNNSKLALTLSMIDDFIARKIPIDGIGFQMHTQLDSPTVADIKASFSQAAARKIKVKITELDVAVNFANATSLSPATALAQKNRYKEIVKAYLETVPPAQRGGITVWGLVDGETWMRSLFNRLEWPLAFNDDYSVKPAYYGIAEALSGK
ncbi:MAG: endo-1,4-beta-xylanase [Marinagarivorans sp.]